MLISALLPAVAAAQSDTDAADRGVIPVIQFDGLLDPVLAEYLMDAIERGNRDNASVIVLQIDSEGSVLDQKDLTAVAAAILESEAPIAAWVGPSGARALGDVAQLVGLADRVGVAPGARIGETGEQTLPKPLFGEIWGDKAPLLLNKTLNHEQVVDLGVAPFPAPIVGEFILTMTDLGVGATAEGGGNSIREQIRFERLGLAQQQLHTVASPPVAYLFFITGLGLLVFEFFTAGVGVAGVLGAGCFLLGSWAFGVLPVRWWAVVLLVLSMIAYSIDIQTGVPRAWTAIGTILFVVGSVFVFDGVGLSWFTLLVGIVSMLAAMIVGMPSMVRTRFSTPTIGRTWLVGEMGTAVEAIVPAGRTTAPDGVVRIDNALWRARTNRATPIQAGEPIRVVAIDGLTLEVEPEEGGARDYRERGSDDEVAEAG